jgi:hypothetical protein
VWGLWFGGWGFGPNPQTPNPQSPIPNPQSPIYLLIIKNKKINYLFNYLPFNKNLIYFFKI